MTMPREVKEDSTYLITRRCLERRFFLRPKRDGEARDTYLYCLALAAEEHGLEIHAFVALSNHHHAVVTDFLAEVPDFAKQLHTNVARAMNKVNGRGGTFWDSTVSYSAVLLVDDEAVLDKIVYTILNPVAARLVERPEEWPGAISLLEQIASGEEIVVQRPAFFRARKDATLACKDRWKRIERKQAKAAFWQEHRRCYVAYFKKRKRRTLFPPGTYAAVHLWGARAAAY